MTTATEALARAADTARLAPSVHNTQPWRWVVRGDRLELYAVTDRQLHEQDPAGRLMLLSCGAALHHARVALDAEGWSHRVERPAAEPLAVVHAIAAGSVDPHAMHLLQLLLVRRTDRRVVSDEPVTPDVREALVDAARLGGARACRCYAGPCAPRHPRPVRWRSRCRRTVPRRRPWPRSSTRR